MGLVIKLVLSIIGGHIVPGLLDFMTNPLSPQPDQFGLLPRDRLLPGRAVSPDNPTPSLGVLTGTEAAAPTPTRTGNSDPWPDRLGTLSQFLVDFGAGMSRAGAGGYNTMGGIGIGLAQAAKAANQRRHAQLLAALIRGDLDRPQSNEPSQMMMSEKLRPPTPAPVGPQALSEALLAPTTPPAAHGMGRHFPDSPPLAAPPRGPMLHADWRMGR